MESGDNEVVQQTERNLGQGPPGAQPSLGEHCVTGGYLEQVCEENRELLCALAVKEGADHDGAEDVVQNTILAARRLKLKDEILELAQCWENTPENIARLKQGLLSLVIHYLLKYHIPEYHRQKKKEPVSIEEYQDRLVDSSGDGLSIAGSLISIGAGERVLLNEETARRAGLNELEIAYLWSRLTKPCEREQDALPDCSPSKTTRVKNSCFEKLMAYLEWQYTGANTIRISR